MYSAYFTRVFNLLQSLDKEIKRVRECVREVCRILFAWREPCGFAFVFVDWGRVRLEDGWNEGMGMMTTAQKLSLSTPMFEIGKKDREQKKERFWS